MKFPALTLLSVLSVLALVPRSSSLSLSSRAWADNAPAAAAPAPTADNNGTATGGIADVTAKIPGKPTLEEVAADTGHVKISLNFVWMLLCGFLVFFMQAGFALLETGFVRAKNAGHVMFMNLSIFFIGVLGYWAVGYALQMGNVAGTPTALGGIAIASGEKSVHFLGHDFGLFATQGFFLCDKFYDMAFWALFLFSVVFMDAACTIPTGAMAERWKTSNFIFFGFVMAAVVYPLYGNWVWGNGWLAMLGSNFGLGHGHVDFAGSTVVHMVGGMAALAGIIVLGPRIGKFDKKGNAQAIPGHHLPMAVLGTLVLGFGWFGFNSGSTLSGNDLRLSAVAVNTMIASCWGGAIAIAWMKLTTGKWDLAMACNGYLAGLVAITAPCAFVNIWGASWIGIVAGLLAPIAYSFIENKLKLDDAVGAVAVHGFNGAWGGLALGLFADGTYGDGWNGVKGNVVGLFYHGGVGQLEAQAIGVMTCLIFVLGFFLLFFKACDKIWGIRVSAEVEEQGLDLPDLGTNAYTEFQLHK